MTDKANPKIIGLFIIFAIGLLITSIFVFSSDSWFSNNQKFTVYFTESINGLNVGAPIKLYGVQVGHVTEIKVERDLKRNMTLIPVTFEVNQEKIQHYVDTRKKNWSHSEVEKLIQAGLRMQLQLSSLLTGQLFIEALFLPSTEATLYGHNNRYKEIPSVPSKSAEIQNALRNVLEGTKTIDLAIMFNDLQKTISHIERITGSEQTQNTLTAANQSMQNLQAILATLRQEIKPLSKNLDQTIRNADKLIVSLDNNTKPLLEDSRYILSTGKNALHNLNSTLSQVQSLTDQDSAISQGLEETLKQLSAAARATRDMMDYLQRNPDALLFGNSPAAEDN